MGRRTARRVALGATLAGIAGVLTGCGGGDTPTPSPTPGPSPTPSPSPSPTPGPSPTPTPTPPPPPPPGPVKCTDDFTRAHCSACAWTGSATVCTACTGGYKLDASAKEAELFCTFSCADFTPPTSKPALDPNPQKYNGIEWPAVCFDDTAARFLAIGDWGGFCGWGKNNFCPPDGVNPSCPGGVAFARKGGPCPMPNRGGPHGTYIPTIENQAQQLVAAVMMKRATAMKNAGTPAQYVINVGDNFYPGGIDFHCGIGDQGTKGNQWTQMWKDIYVGDLAPLEWWSVLGNHDYGGVCYIKGWDQQIFYTWHDDKWVMPAQYWKRVVQYKNFQMEFYMIDANIYDTRESVDDNHNICSTKSNPGKFCETENWPPLAGTDASKCGAYRPNTWQDCRQWFKTLWQDVFNWMKTEIPKSTAEWQVVVSHYPAQYGTGDAGSSWVYWPDYGTLNGIELHIAGHTHAQEIYYGDFGPGKNMGDMAWVICGGGGGVTAEQIPVVSGMDNAYGFMEFEITLNEMKITTRSHGGVNGDEIVRNSTSVRPIPRAPLHVLDAKGYLSDDYKLWAKKQGISFAPPRGPAIEGVSEEAPVATFEVV